MFSWTQGRLNMYVPLKIHCCRMLWEKPTMSVIYADNVWHHSQSFRIMVKGWKWDPHIWYDVLYNWPSTHKISCKYLNVDQSYDGMHLFPHWTTLYSDAWKTCKDLEFSLAAILKILNGGYHKNQVMYPHIFMICFTNKQIFMQIFTCTPKL